MNIKTTIARAGRIVILGDVMLDYYLSGQVSRISPEAPVPILRHVSETMTAGGAANVALNIASVGGSASLIGLIGADADGAHLTRKIEQAGIRSRLVEAEDRATITKTRVMSGRQHQFLRIDREETGPLPAATEEAIVAEVAQSLDEDAVALVISDYGKGCLSDAVLSRAIEHGRARGVPVLVDPKRIDFSNYRGATYIKPNLAEICAATGIDCSTDGGMRSATRAITEQTGASVLLTMSERGMAFYPANGAEPISMPTRARDVFDVSGAGDTVMALFALMVAVDAPISQALHVANVAAGLVVSKAGTATLTAGEIAQGLKRAADESAPHESPVLGWSEARTLRDRWRANGLDVGFTNGCFDLLHPGHIGILRGARACCDKLIVGLNSDASVRRLKGESRPIQDQEARAHVMSAIGGVDAVVIFDEDTPLELIQALEPDVLVKGADYAEKDIVGGDVVKAAGGRIERVALVDGHSTTRLVHRSHRTDDPVEVS